MNDALARVDWQLGQTLLPDHFIAEEESLLSDVKTRFGLLGLPMHGIGRLKWNDSLLAEGVLSLTALTMILPNGQVIDVPGNAVADTFNMNVTGTTKVPVWLHLTSERAEPTNGAGGSRRDRDDGESLPRVVHRIALTSEQAFRNAIQTLKLAEFEKTPEGEWTLGAGYAPPLLQVGTSPFLAGLVDRLMKTLEMFHFKLQEDIAASYLGGEGLFGAKLCLEGVYRMQRFLANLRGEVHYHPYFLYEALKSFYVDLCLFQNTTPENVTSPYRHDELAACLAEVVDPLMAQITITRDKTPYLSFERKEGLFVLPEIPIEVRRAKEVYLLLQKPKITEVLSLEGFKLAGRSRLPVVHQLSLQGIPLTRIERPPFQHNFGAEVEFFLLHEGEEWDLALGEGAVAFFDQPHFAKVKAFMYWRQG